jgi:hypothetical protein
MVLKRHYYSEDTLDIRLDQEGARRRTVRIDSRPDPEQTAPPPDIRLPNVRKYFQYFPVPHTQPPTHHKQVKTDKAGAVLGERPKEEDLVSLRRLLVHLAAQLLSEGVTPADIGAIVSCMQVHQHEGGGSDLRPSHT